MMIPESKAANTRTRRPSARAIVLHLRQGVWYLKRNVPKEYQSVEARKVIWKALLAQSEKAARAEAETLWRRLLRQWHDAALTGPHADITKARAAAHRMGLRYLPVDQVAKLPTDALLDRIEAVVDVDGAINMTCAAATLGLQPKLSISAVYQTFSQADRMYNSARSPSQQKKARQKHDHVIRLLTAKFGDINPYGLTRRDIHDLQNDWLDEYPPLAMTTVNGRLFTLDRIFSRAGPFLDKAMKFKFKEFRVKRTQSKTRLPFSTDWIAQRILGAGALDGLDVQARSILLAMINTGLRPSECANLAADEIVLSGPIPHLQLTGKLRPLKTHAAHRKLPLFGVSLEAFRQCPNGFPDYRDSLGLTTKLNRYLTKHGLRETPRHSLYGLRHAFGDRLYNSKPSEQIKAYAMGHKPATPSYGAGPRLEGLAEVFEKIALL